MNRGHGKQHLFIIWLDGGRDGWSKQFNQRESCANAGVVVVLMVWVWRGRMGRRTNLVANVRAIPPIPKAMTPGDKRMWRRGWLRWRRRLRRCGKSWREGGVGWPLLPDVEIYYNALRYPLIYNEPYDMKLLKKQIGEGMDRAKSLREGKRRG